MSTRSIFAGVFAAVSLCAAPQPLTTIQDTLYKADGSRFSGSLTISWTTFEAIDHTQILQQSKTVAIVDGNLQVQLVPTTTATPTAYYTVVYNSDGRVQFQETWAVPSSAQPLRVRDVRIATPGSSTAAGSSTSPVEQADVVGLVSDLGARPLKGAAYATGRVAWVNPSGALESVTGSPTDCVRVDGSSGPCGGEQPSFADGETPAGIADGANTVFTLAAVPYPAGSLAVFRNGMLQKGGLDYNLSANTVQFVSAAVPQAGDTLLASYRVAPAGSSTNQLYPNAQVLCSGLGAATTADTLSAVGTCAIPAGFLAAGDRIEIRFDFDHQGGAAGYSFEVRWGASTLLHRDATAGDALATGRLDLALRASGAQVSHQSWGTFLGLAVGIGTAADDYFTNGIPISFQANANGGDVVTLRSFSVVRVP
jgi:hypothetical protein